MQSSENGPAVPCTDAVSSFRDLELPESLQATLAELDHQVPTPIQSATIPALLAGQDLIGQAQTGTGKTAAFCLPMLARLKPGPGCRALVLTPTRELAGQVAEACQAYGKRSPGLSVAAIYGGAGYHDQLRQLRRGAQVVVGTPGRVMDHLRRGTLDVAQLDLLVLDEADEMLRMGFIDDVEWILEQLPDGHQTALFSATMPREIRAIAHRHLRDPVEIAIRAATASATTVRQRCCLVRAASKGEVLARFLETEPVDAALVFTRTKVATAEVAELLHRRGIPAAALNGDMPQAERERVVERLRSGSLDVLVATDVAARGLDVARISHVFNYDLPHDGESYVHRVGRTGRAGRDGEAILFVEPRERRSLRFLERHARQAFHEVAPPTAAAVNARRRERFAERITEAAAGDLGEYEGLVADIVGEQGVDPVRLAAALARMVHGDRPLSLPEGGDPVAPMPVREEASDTGHEEFRLDVGRVHGCRPAAIVGAIANELGVAGKAIGAIRIHDAWSTVALPVGLGPEAREILRRIRVCGRPLAAEPTGRPVESSRHASMPRRHAPRHGRHQAPRAHRRS